MKLGSNVCYIDLEDYSVKEGSVIDNHITSSGYSACLLKCENMIKSVEASLIFKDKLKAEIKLELLKPKAERLKEYSKHTSERINRMREGILGKPDLKEFIDARK